MCLFIRAFSMGCGLPQWRWESPLRQPFCQRAPQRGSCRWKFCGMNEYQESARKNHIAESIWRAICSYRDERQVGETGAHPSTPGWGKSPPQAVENRKIRRVSVWRKTALLSAGKGLAEMGNTLGQRTQNLQALRAARGLRQKHLRKEKEQRAGRPKGQATE